MKTFLSNYAEKCVDGSSSTAASSDAISREEPAAPAVARTHRLTGATYGEFVGICSAFGIKRTTAYAYKKAGFLSTFRLPGTKTNLILVEELEALPARLLSGTQPKGGVR